jgi:hypothetical protein
MPPDPNQQDLEASAAHLLELTAELQAIADRLRAEARHLQTEAANLQCQIRIETT